MIERKKIVILGSTGSIGRSTLQVIKAHEERLQVVALAAGRNYALLAEQIREFRPEFVSIEDESNALQLRQQFPDVSVFSGLDAARKLVQEVAADMVVAAISGTAGLAPIVAAIELGMDIALANKEALVSAGPFLMDLVESRGVQLLPVDSEHSALWQAIHGRPLAHVKRLILTASGGPFFGQTRDKLRKISVDEALNHPTWRMGGKISVDSATLMNKGLEVIEAHHLFGVGYDAINVLVHPESIVHSMVELVDGSEIAQCSIPDMRLPIQLALSYPERWPAEWVNNRHAGTKWQFFHPDLNTFRCLELALQAGRAGGVYPALLNAANDVAVGAFLAGHIGFLDIEVVVEQVLNAPYTGPFRCMQDVFAADEFGKKAAQSSIKGLGGGKRS